MFITCWSAKGGSGTTVVAAVLACALADELPTMLVDLAGDLPAALGLAEPAAGLTDWAGRRGGSSAPPPGSPRSLTTVGGQAGGGLSRLELDGARGVRLLPRGPGSLGQGVGPALVGELAGRASVVVDGGVACRAVPGTGPLVDVAAAATASLLVIRPCFLALRRAVAVPLRPTGVVVVDEPQRVLGPSDIEAALGVAVVAVVPWEPAVARRVDAGLLGSAPPRAMARALAGVLRSGAAVPARRLAVVPAPARHGAPAAGAPARPGPGR